MTNPAPLTVDDRLRKLGQLHTLRTIYNAAHAAEGLGRLLREVWYAELGDEEPPFDDRSRGAVNTAVELLLELATDRAIELGRMLGLDVENDRLVDDAAPAAPPAAPGEPLGPCPAGTRSGRIHLTD